jgi:ankyrin repeat protein
MSGERNTSSQSVDALLEELTAFCRSESLSEDDLREIIGRHGVAPNNDPDMCYDFFHEACRNERVTEGILQFLLEYFPYAASATDDAADYYCGGLPLHFIFDNSNVTLGMVQLLIDASPDSVRHETNDNELPLHCLSNGPDVGEEVAAEILKLLLEKCPESVRHAASNGNHLPIHFAAGNQSPEFCRILVEAYHGSERITNYNGYVPFHLACADNNVATAKYLYKLYPESINVAAYQCNLGYAI